LLGPWSAAAGLPWQGWLGLVPAVLVPWGLGRRLGGHSGDTYGACVEWTCSWTLLLIALALMLPVP
jgi:adenosylcobinamide-GDP ribazoletransferase